MFNVRKNLLIAKKVCLGCFCPQKQVSGRENTIRCGKRRCRITHKTKNIFAFKPFLETRLNNHTVLMIIKAIFMNSSIRFIAMFFRVDIKTIRKIRNQTLLFIKKYVKKTLGRIGGSEIKVEMDESAFGKRKYNRGSRRKTIWVLGAVEKTAQRRIRLCMVKKRNAIAIRNSEQVC
ncbi:hypothetical protein BDAP_001154, partial [Binucleata daphniae]